MHNALPLSLGKNTYKTNVEKFSSKLVTSTVMPVPAEGGTEPSEPGDSSQGGKSILCSQITAQHGVSCPLHSDQIFSISHQNHLSVEQGHPMWRHSAAPDSEIPELEHRHFPFFTADGRPNGEWWRPGCKNWPWQNTDVQPKRIHHESNSYISSTIYM
jgi:hypothetical protein